MIKFGNDIVTVGGDWLKMPPEPEKFLNVPIAADHLDAGSLIDVGNVGTARYNYRNSNYRFTLIKLLYTNLNGELTWFGNNIAPSPAQLTIDITRAGDKVISPYGYLHWSNPQYSTPYFTNAISYDGVVNAEGTIERTGTSLIDRIIYDWALSKIHFYDISNNLIASADLTMVSEGSQLFQDCVGEYYNPGSERTTGNIGAYGWHCSTLAQCLSL